MIYLQTNRLVIRDHRLDDLGTHFALFSNEKAMYYLPGMYIKTIEEAKKDLDNTISENDKEDRKKYFFRINDRHNETHIGDIGYTVMKTTPINPPILKMMYA